MKRIIIGLLVLSLVLATVPVTADTATHTERAFGKSSINVAGIWVLGACGNVQGATEHTPCCPPEGAQPGDCGTELNGPFCMGDPDIHVTQSGNTIFASEGDVNENPFTLRGRIGGNSVVFTIKGEGINPCLPGSHTTNFYGKIKGATIEGRFSGYGCWSYEDEEGNIKTEHYTWRGKFTVTIERSECSVEITGPLTNVLYCPVFKSPKLLLDSIVDPPGGDYEWEIIKGQDKVQFVGSANSESVIIQGIAPSEDINDVKIKLKYTIDSQTCEDIHYVTVQKPTFLKVLDGYPKTKVQYNDAGQVVDYTTTYYFQVMDQLNPANPINARMGVWEGRKRVCANYHPGPTLPSSTQTNELGAFPDELKPPRYIIPIPEDLLIMVQQRMRVEGCPIGFRCQTYYYDHGTSEEGICGQCE